MCFDIFSRTRARQCIGVVWTIRWKQQTFSSTCRLPGKYVWGLVQSFRFKCHFLHPLCLDRSCGLICTVPRFLDLKTPWKNIVVRGSGNRNDTNLNVAPASTRISWQLQPLSAHSPWGLTPGKNAKRTLDKHVATKHKSVLALQEAATRFVSRVDRNFFY